MLNILVVDDDKELLNGIAKELSVNYNVTTADNGAIALDIVERQKFDCVLIDIVMPQINGYEFCRALRERMDCTIIFMSCLTEAETVGKCFELGADDFISKPFGFGELKARINARTSNAVRSELVYGDLVIDNVRNRVTYKKNPIVLTNIEYDLLYFLASHPDEPYNKEDLYHQIWKQDSLDSTHTVQAHIFTLRKKLQEKTQKDYITTFWKKGYFFNPKA